MDSYSLHLAMAALLGASFVAVSAYYMHSRTLTQLYEFAKRDRDGEEEGGRGGDSPQHYRKYIDKKRSHGKRKTGNYRRASTSMPDVTAIAEAEENRNGPVSVDDRNFSIPAGLPRLHTLPEGIDTELN